MITRVSLGKPIDKFYDSFADAVNEGIDVAEVVGISETAHYYLTAFMRNKCAFFKLNPTLEDRKIFVYQNLTLAARMGTVMHRKNGSDCVCVVRREGEPGAVLVIRPNTNSRYSQQFMVVDVLPEEKWRGALPARFELPNCNPTLAKINLDAAEVMLGWEHLVIDNIDRINHPELRALICNYPGGQEMADILACASQKEVEYVKRLLREGAKSVYEDLVKTIKEKIDQALEEALTRYADGLVAAYQYFNPSPKHFAWTYLLQLPLWRSKEDPYLVIARNGNGGYYVPTLITPNYVKRDLTFAGAMA